LTTAEVKELLARGDASPSIPKIFLVSATLAMELRKMHSSSPYSLDFQTLLSCAQILPLSFPSQIPSTKRIKDIFLVFLIYDYWGEGYYYCRFPASLYLNQLHSLTKRDISKKLDLNFH
jgi:hypothetical protein